jgi:hypothetical protein
MKTSPSAYIVHQFSQPLFLFVQGIYTSRQTSVVAIIGGAGQYEKAKGQVEITQTGTNANGDSTYDYKIFLK